MYRLGFELRHSQFLADFFLMSWKYLGYSRWVSPLVPLRTAPFTEQLKLLTPSVYYVFQERNLAGTAFLVPAQEQLLLPKCALYITFKDARENRIPKGHQNKLCRETMQNKYYSLSSICKHRLQTQLPCVSASAVCTEENLLLSTV